MNGLTALTSYSEIQDAIREIRLKARKKGEKIFSNFFPNPLMQNEWIEQGNLRLYKGTSGILLVHHTEFVDEVYFVISNEAELQSMIKSLSEDSRCPLILEQVITNSDDSLSFLEPVDRTLLRYSRTGLPNCKQPTAALEFATKMDYETLRNIFLTYFDPITDRLPSKNDLLKLIAGNSVLIRKQSGKIIGFLIYELTGISIHLRYWWTSPDYRNQGVGSELLRQFFAMGEDTKRQYLWVDKINDNAIIRYRHYGFEYDGMEDRIKVLKQTTN